MKLVCDACGTKYSIGDDKVAGKVFKIRCKKCSHVIVVRGVVAPVTPVLAGDWHAVIDGQPLGPFAADEVSRRRAAGELDDDAYVWREGMTDWVPLGSIETFRRPTEVAAAPSDVGACTDPPDPTRLRGERNDSSVLFTLGNLARLAAPRPTAAGPAPGDEGSGLIDIRALASTLVQPAAKPATAGFVADLPVYAPAGFGEPIVLVPTPRRRGPDRALVIAVAGLAAMLVAVASVLIIVLVGGKAAQEAGPAAQPQLAMAAVTPSTPPEPLGGAQPPAPVAEPPPVVQTPVIPPPRRTSPPAPRRPPARAVAPPHTTTLQPRPGSDDTCTEVSCEFHDYAGTCCERFKPPAARRAAAASPRLPEDLDRAMLKAGIATIPAQACGDRSSARGDVNVSIKVSPAGTVTRVTIKSSPDAALSACVTAAARRGSFAKTVRGGTFAYFWRF